MPFASLLAVSRYFCWFGVLGNTLKYLTKANIVVAFAPNFISLLTLSTIYPQS